jgi:signal transduction histidine kinase
MNAVQASNPGGTIQVQSRVTPSPDAEWTFEIKNQGDLIEPKNLPLIFQPFFSTKKDGVGLGLAVCRKIIEEHGGTISCSSDPKQGTAFRFSIPLALTEGANSV